MKILMLLDHPFPPDTRVENEMKSLTDAGFEVHIACFQKNKEPLLERKEYGIIHRKPVSKFIYKSSVGVLKFPFYFNYWRRFVKELFALEKFDVIHVHENELMTSIGNLAERWHWSKDKVRRYLKMLEDGGFVKVVPYTCGTIIKLENIGISGDGANDDKTANKTAYKYRHEYDHKDDGKTSNESRLKKERKDKKDKNQKNQEGAQRPMDCFCWEGDPE